METEIERKTSFDLEADLYHARRPHYPQALFDDLVRVANLQPEAALLEIGPGPGHATKPLAERGFHIMAVELGPVMARRLRSSLAGFPNVQVVNAAFEQIYLPDAAFDLVYAARSIHWIDPEVKFSKPHRLLRSEGHLAIIRTHDVSDNEGDLFFHASQPVYTRYESRAKDSRQEVPTLETVQPTELDGGLFERIHFKAFPVAIDYSAIEYAELLNTYSATIAMPPKDKEAFLAEIRELIDVEFGGQIRRSFVMSLTVGKRKG